MATKVTILGQEPKEEKKPITFCAYIMRNGLSINKEILKEDSPSAMREIQLLPNGDAYEFDILRCQRPSGEWIMILGHFNDGIV